MGLRLAPFPVPVPAALSETSVRVPSAKSRTKMSSFPLASPGIRLDAEDWKAIRRPSAEMDGREDSEFPWAPELDREIMLVVARETVASFRLLSRHPAI